MAGGFHCRPNKGLTLALTLTLTQTLTLTLTLTSHQLAALQRAHEAEVRTISPREM